MEKLIKDKRVMKYLIVISIIFLLSCNRYKEEVISITKRQYKIIDFRSNMYLSLKRIPDGRIFDELYIPKCYNTYIGVGSVIEIDEIRYMSGNFKGLRLDNYKIHDMYCNE